MSSESLETAQKEYQAGKACFERGLYRQSVQHLEKASALLAPNTRLGGEVQIWLVTAYEAADQRSEAIALCRQLNRHPSIETRKQSRRLLYILEAPRLVTRPEWLTQIPDLAALEEGQSKVAQLSPATPKRPPRKKAPTELEPVDLSQVNTQDNSFIWISLIALALILGSLIWLS